jgi:DNA-binding NarL/FixJ family response regulator
MPGMEYLTETQRLYLQFLVDGLSQKQIAARVGRNRETIKAALSQARSRLGLQSTYQVIAVAVSQGWVVACAFPGQSDNTCMQ